MTKPIKAFNKVTFDWPMHVEEREKVESLLRTLGYRVDGGGTNLTSRSSEIFLRPKVRVHRRKEKSEVVS
jgi:hypothetical protein